MTAHRIRLRTLGMLIFAAAVSAAPLSFASARVVTSRLVSTTDKDCVYAGQAYSNGACRGGQRCVTGKGDVDYWQDDTSCPPASPGPTGGRPII
jgi:hypothetical protein